MAGGGGSAIAGAGILSHGNQKARAAMQIRQVIDANAAAQIDLLANAAVADDGQAFFEIENFLVVRLVQSQAQLGPASAPAGEDQADDFGAMLGRRGDFFQFGAGGFGKQNQIGIHSFLFSRRLTRRSCIILYILLHSCRESSPFWKNRPKIAKMLTLLRYIFNKKCDRKVEMKPTS